LSLGFSSQPLVDPTVNNLGVFDNVHRATIVMQMTSRWETVGMNLGWLGQRGSNLSHGRFHPTSFTAAKRIMGSNCGSHDLAPGRRK
jgi:hypothetical protein